MPAASSRSPPAADVYKRQGFIWLAVVAVLASLVGAFYYLRIVKVMYFDDAVDTAPVVARGDSLSLIHI